MNDIHFAEQGIGKLIADGKLRVAVHQRDYYWPVEKVSDLFDDFDNAIRNGETHFLGTIVLRKTLDGFEVVDGQQRLATTTIMLAAIRDIFASRTDETMVGSIQEQFLFRFDRKIEDLVPKLKLNTKDDEYFRNRVLASPGKTERIAPSPFSGPSNRRLHGAAIEIRSRFEQNLKAAPEATRKDFLKRWLDFIEEEASVVVLTVQNEENAYALFETLNDRGIRVSEADLIKNYLFKISGEDKLDDVVARWAATGTIIDSLGPKEDLIDYLRIVSTVFYGLTTERKVFKTIKGQNSSQTQAVRFLHQLEQYAVDYAAMLTPDHPKWNEYPPSIRKALRTLALFDVMQIRYLMLAVAHHFSEKEAVLAFNLFVNWIVRFFIAGAEKIGRVDKVYARLAHAVYKEEIKTAALLAQEMRPHLASDPEFESEFAVARVSQGKLARYYLDALERTAVDGEDAGLVPDDDTSKVNLEHVIPLNPGDEWPRIDEENAGRLYNRLGNLALLNAKKNARIGRVAFCEKRKSFTGSPFVLTKAIAKLSETEWGESEVNMRQILLSKLAVKTWPLTVS